MHYKGDSWLRSLRGNKHIEGADLFPIVFQIELPLRGNFGGGDGGVDGQGPVSTRQSSPLAWEQRVLFFPVAPPNKSQPGA